MTAETTAGADATLEWIATYRFPARADRLKLVRELVKATALACGFHAAAARDVVIAVDEACQNIIRHGYGGQSEGPGDAQPIAVEIRRGPDRVVFLVRDQAPVVAADRVRPRDLDDLRPGGLGTHFISAVMDEVSFVTLPPGQGNLLRMMKRLGETAS